MNVRLLAYAAVLLLAQPAWAVDIDIRHTDGTKTPLGGTGAVADMNLATLLACEDQANSLCMVSGGAVRFSYLGVAVTTDTTSASITLPTGPKSVYAVLTGTGAITQTIKIYSGVATGFTPSTEGILLCTLTLSGTTTVADQCPVITAPGLFYKQVTSSTSGTSASSTTVVQY